MVNPAKQKITDKIENILLEFADDRDNLTRSDLQGVATAKAFEIYDLVKA